MSSDPLSYVVLAVALFWILWLGYQWGRENGISEEWWRNHPDPDDWTPDDQ